LTLLAFAAEHRAAAALLLLGGEMRLSLLIDISCPQGSGQQTRRTPMLLSIDGTDR